MNRSLAPHLAAAFAKARPVRASATMVAVVVAAVMLTLTTAQSFQQSGKQSAAVATGRSDYALRLPIEESLGQAIRITDAPVLDAIRQTGAGNPRAGINVFHVPIDGHAPTWINLQEQDWSGNPFPTLYLLQEGRLPTAPGEVAVSQTLFDVLGWGKVTLANGAVDLQVVGVVRDESNRSAPLGLVSPGTLARAHETASTVNVTGTRSYYWDSVHLPPEQVVGVIAAQLGATGVELPPVEELMLNLNDRRAIVADESKLYSEIALLMLLAPFTAGLLSGWLGSRFINRTRETLMQIGIARTTFASVVAIAGSTLIAATVGAAVGVMGGVTTRPLLDAQSNQQLGPIYGLESYVPAVIMTTLVGVGAGISYILTSRQPRSRPRKERLRPSLIQLLPAFSALSLILGIILAQSGDLNVRFAAPFMFGFTVVTLTPYALTLVTRIRSDSLAVTLGIRQLDAERTRVSAVAVALAAVLMLALSVLFVSFSITATLNVDRVSRMPAGQVLLAPLNPVTGIENLRGEIEEFAGVSDPVSLSSADVSPDFQDGSIMVIQAPQDVERLLEISLTPQQVQSLDNGALLRHKSSPTKTERITFADGTNATLPIIQLTETITNHPGFGGFITQDTAAQLGFPTVLQSWVYVNVSPEQSTRLLDASAEFGFSPSWIVAYHPPQPISEPPLSLLIAFGSGLVASVLVAYYTSAMTRALRPTLAALQAVGVRSLWLRTVVLIQIGAVVLTAVVSAWLGAALAVYLSTLTWISNTRLNVPWVSSSILLGTLLLAAALFLWKAQRRLSALER